MLYIVFNFLIPVQLVIILIWVINTSIFRAYIFEITLIIITCYLIFFGVEIWFYALDGLLLIWDSNGSDGSGSSGNTTGNTGGSSGSPSGGPAGGPQNSNESCIPLAAGSESSSATGDSNTGGEASQETRGNSLNTQETPITQINVPAKLYKLSITINKNINRMKNNNQVQNSMINARTALEKYIYLTRQSDASRYNAFVYSNREDKIKAWLKWLDSFQDRER